MSKLINGYPAEWISAEVESEKKLDWKGIGHKGQLTVCEYEHSLPGKNSLRFVPDNLSYIRTSYGEVRVSGDRLTIYTHGGEHIYTFRLTGGEMRLPERYWHICDACGKRELLSSKEAFERGWKYPGPDGAYRDVILYGFARKRLPRMCKSCSDSGRMYGWMQYKFAGMRYDSEWMHGLQYHGGYGGSVMMSVEDESKAEMIKAQSEAQEAIDWMEKTREEREKRIFLEPWSLVADGKDG